MVEQKNQSLYDDFPQHIDSICKKYGLAYLDENGKGKGDISITELFKPDTRIYKGNNRHKGLLRTIDSLISRNRDILPLDDIKEFAMKCNQRLCDPPLDDKDFNRTFAQAAGMIMRKEMMMLQQEQPTIRPRRMKRRNR